jgi:type I restriction enzyme M protein
MLTGELKSQIDKVWEAFWTGGLSNPLTVIEQMTYLLFLRRLDELQTLKEKKAATLKKPIEEPIYKTSETNLRWSHFKNTDPEIMFELFRKKDGIFDFLKNVGSKDSTFSKFMKGATFMIPTPRLLAQVVEMLSNLDMRDRDTKGDVYEYLLGKIAQAGRNGQFRTPRHIISLMVELVKPTIEDIICDPASGTSGFLVASSEYVRRNFENELYDKKHKLHFQEKMFMGMEFDPTMIRIGAMNLILHGIENPHLIDVDALSEANANFTEDATLILANPPFKGSLDRGAVQKLQAVISMPSGVFKPYAGVSTAIILFTKTNSGGTDHVWFYDMQSDGFSLDDKRQPLDSSDIPDIQKRFQHLKAESKRTRTDQSFLVPKSEIVANKYDLSINRYKEIEHEEKSYSSPSDLIEQIESIDKERLALLKQLKGLLK